jgi:hypothetical protein
VVALPGGRGDAGGVVDLFGPRVLLSRRIAQGLGGIAQRGAGPVGDDIGDLGGVVPAVGVVDVPDGLLAAVGLDVDVDVRRPVPFGGQEPLEQQPPLHRVGVGDAQRITDRGVGGRAAALGQDVALAAEPDDVPYHEEVPGEPELLDHP